MMNHPISMDCLHYAESVSVHKNQPYITWFELMQPTRMWPEFARMSSPSYAVIQPQVKPGAFYDHSTILPELLHKCNSEMRSCRSDSNRQHSKAIYTNMEVCKFTAQKLDCKS